MQRAQNQNIQLNVVPFTMVYKSGTFAFYGDKQKDSYPIYWSNVLDEFPADRDPAHKFYYSDFMQARPDAIVKEIQFENAIGFSLHYFRRLVFNYFRNIIGSVVFPNYVNDIGVWFKDPYHKNNIYDLYNCYTVKVQFRQVTDGFEFVLAYNGTSKILKKSIADISDFDTTKYNKVNCNGIVYKYENMPEDLRQEQQNLFPILSYQLKKEFLDEPEELKQENRYPIYFTHIQSFFDAFINTDAFKQFFIIDPNGFYKVPPDRVFHTYNKSNELQFKNGNDINPFLGMRTYKPLKAFTENHVKLFFIYHEQDGVFIRDTFYNYITNGWNAPVGGYVKRMSNLQTFINQPLSIDRDKRIIFRNNDTIFEEVAEQLKSFNDTSARYVAIYISPIEKSDTSNPQHLAYYKIKELLLNKGISSQVIYKEHLNDPNFYYFLPNIYVALLAKIGGIPWRLARTREDEIIIGVGAFKPMGARHRFLGSAFCFSNDGLFENFDCFRDDEPELLAGSIRNAVERFIAQKKTAKRVIIHFYKEISNKKELQPILDMLDNLGHSNIPVIVVTVNKTNSRELLGFDIASNGKMPYSGSYVKVGYKTYLLFNNVRYTSSSRLNARDYHFPIKLSIKATNPDLIKDINVIRELIDQVYQFSRMYWKSIAQQNMPVTIKYPEMVAEIFPHFDNDNLPEFGKRSLWFL